MPSFREYLEMRRRKAIAVLCFTTLPAGLALLALAWKGTLGEGWFFPAVVLTGGLVGAWDLQRIVVNPECSHIQAVPEHLRRRWTRISLLAIGTTISVIVGGAALLGDGGRLWLLLLALGLYVGAAQAAHLMLTTHYIAPTEPGGFAVDQTGSLSLQSLRRIATSVRVPPRN